MTCTVSGFSVIIRTGLVIAVISLLSLLFHNPLIFSYDSLEVICPPPDVKYGKLISGFGPIYNLKDSIMFGCNKGYILKGSSIIHCEADNTWNPPPPICELSKYEP